MSMSCRRGLVLRALEVIRRGQSHSSEAFLNSIGSPNEPKILASSAGRLFLQRRDASTAISRVAKQVPMTELHARNHYMSTDVMGSPVDEQRRRLLNRILYRSKQRGYLELDLLLGKWAQDNITSLDDSELRALVEVLDEENPDLWQWLSGQSETPEKFANNPVYFAIHKKVAERLEEHSSTATRAQPGSPWVRGWDDNQKSGTPKIGNQ